MSIAKSKSLMSVIALYMNTNELAKFAKVCKNFEAVCKYENVWKELGFNTFEFFNKKRKQTYRDAYKRKYITYKEMSQEQRSINYTVANLRAHKDLVTHMDICDNLIFSVDKTNLLIIWLIDEEEYDEEPQFQTYDQLPSNVIHLQYVQELTLLVLLLENSSVITFKVEEISNKEFKFELRYEIPDVRIKAEMKPLSLKPIIDYNGTNKSRLYIMNDPNVENNGMNEDSTLCIFNLENGEFIKSIILLDLDVEMGGSNVIG